MPRDDRSREERTLRQAVALPESIRVTETELLHFLESCGIVAKYSAGDTRGYLCAGKR